MNVSAIASLLFSLETFVLDSYRLIFIHVVASSFYITPISSKVLGCDFCTTSSENANQCASAIKVEIVPLLELELPTNHVLSKSRGCRLVGSVEPLGVLLAKLDEQMIGDKWLLLPFSAQSRTIGSSASPRDWTL